MHQLSDTQATILSSLARYRFLTIDQMRELGITTGKSPNHLYKITADLCHTPALVDKYQPKPIHGKGAFPSLYFLTKKGADALSELTQEPTTGFKFPKGKVSFSSLLVHTIRCVSCEIAVRLWAEKNHHTVDFYHNDFDTQGDNATAKNGKLRKLTAIDLNNGERLIPDAVFHITDRDGTPRLFLLELHNQARAKRIHDKLASYREAIAEEAIRRQFGYEQSPRVLAILDNAEHVKNALDHMDESGKFRGGWEPYFYLKTLEDLKTDFRFGWQTVGGMVSLF